MWNRHPKLLHNIFWCCCETLDSYKLTQNLSGTDLLIVTKEERMRYWLYDKKNNDSKHNKQCSKKWVSFIVHGT